MFVAVAVFAPVASQTYAMSDEKVKNHVRVSSKQSKFLYVDIVKYLLNEGEKYVDISGLGTAIVEVVEIAEVLKAQGLVKVLKIETSRGVEGRKSLDRICIRVDKTGDFQKIFDEQQAARAARKEKEADAKK